jgi:flagellar hook-associated protein 3 FlgL
MIGRVGASNEGFLHSLDQIQRRLASAQAQISSGRRMNRASDDPDQVSRLLTIRSQLSAVRQDRMNLGRVQSEVAAAEQGLQHGIELMDRILVLGTQGATNATPLDSRLTLAGEVGALLAQLVGVSTAAADGRYIFSGDSDSSIPYTVNLEANPPYSAYQGSSATREILHPTGIRMRVARTAEQIFEDPDPSRNVFGSVLALRDALAGGDVDSIKDALNRVRTAAVHLNNELAFYGAAQNEIAQSLSYAHQEELRLTTELSRLEDADLTEAILEMNQAQIHQEAALGAGARIQKRPSLFDFLR